MNTAFQVLILSLVTLPVAALVGGGIGLLVMRLFGRLPAHVDPTESRDSMPEPT